MKSIFRGFVVFTFLFSYVYAQKIVGTIKPYSKTLLKAEVSGVIKSINYNISDKVKKEDVLVEIDKEDYSLEYELALANKRLKEINKKFLEEEYKRYKNLVKTKSITAQIYEDKKRAYLISKLESKISDINLLKTKRSLEKTKIKATYDGLIANKYIELGDFVQSGDSLLLLIDKRLKAVFYVLSDDYEKFEAKKKVKLNIPDLGNKKIDGEILLVSPLINENTTGYKMEVLLEELIELKADFEIELFLDEHKE